MKKLIIMLLGISVVWMIAQSILTHWSCAFFAVATIMFGVELLYNKGPLSAWFFVGCVLQAAGLIYVVRHYPGKDALPDSEALCARLASVWIIVTAVVVSVKGHRKQKAGDATT